MSIAAQSARRCASKLLTVLVAIMFLSAPMAEVGAATCDRPTAQIERAEIAPDFDHSRDGRVDCQSVCCSNLNWCQALFPAPDNSIFLQVFNARQKFELEQPIKGVTAPPALGPPRSLV